jgi:hypothetical protein
MTDAERCTLIMLLNELRPVCSIEIGTFKGGSLSVLSKFSRKVYTLDIDPTCCERFSKEFSNVEFITGPSKKTFPPLLKQIQKYDERLEFVLIDANHTKEGVKLDIDNLLEFKPTQPLFVIIHDSFNPDCRQGIIEANWTACPYVHFVEIDFVPGLFNPKVEYYRQMWCGFTLAILLPQKRIDKLQIHANEELLFKTVLPHSVHHRSRWSSLSIVRRLGGKVFRLAFETITLDKPQNDIKYFILFKNRIFYLKY